MMRRTQKERSEPTRRKLVEAAARCLSRDGYGASSTTRIAQEAGVSRGAQLHHFPNRASLMKATILHVFHERVVQFRGVMAERAGRPMAELVRPLWEAASATEVFVPWLELTVAGRSDPAIAEALESVTREMREETAEIAAELGPETGRVAAFASTLLDGLALQQLAAPDPERMEQALALLEQLAALLEEQ